MTDEELWTRHVQEPHYRLQCGQYVYVSDWQTLGEIQRAGAGISVDANGNLRVEREHKLSSWQVDWLAENANTAIAILDDELQRAGAPQ